MAGREKAFVSSVVQEIGNYVYWRFCKKQFTQRLNLHTGKILKFSSSILNLKHYNYVASNMNMNFLNLQSNVAHFKQIIINSTLNTIKIKTLA